MNPKVYLRDRILTPLLLAILAAGIIVTIIINVSRVLLAVGGGTGVYVSCAIATTILLTAVWAGTRTKLPAYSGMFVLALAGIGSLIAGSVSFNRAEPHESSAAVIPYATADSVEAAPDGSSLVFDKTALTATVSTAAPGIHFTLSSGGGTHTFLIHGHEGQLALEANPGKPEDGTIELPAGDYVFYCDIPGHEAAGMHGTLTVVADPNAQPINAPAGGAEGETTTAAH